MEEPMIYLAGSSTDLARVTHWRDRLVAAGITVGSSWLDVVVKVGSANPRAASCAERHEWSVADLAEIRECDALWFLVPAVDNPTRGAWLELGYAAALDRWIICSGDTKQSIFAALGLECERDEDAFAAVKAWAEGRRSA
jgi:nucleoside 2-deoxyribosyltransferase